MFWRKKQQAVESTAKVEPVRNGGLFSTHLEAQDDGQTMQKRAKSMLESLQKKLVASKPRIHDAQGNVVAAAMDSIDSGIADPFALSQPNMSEALVMYFASKSFIGHQLAAIVSQDPMIYKACNQPARDAIRQGYEIVITEGDAAAGKIVTELARIDEELDLDSQMEEWVTKGRIFGIRIAFFKFKFANEDEKRKYYESPFNPDGIPEEYEGIVQIDPYWTAPQLNAEASSRPDAIDFYEPTWWQIDGIRYHRTHLCIFRHCEVPDILKPSYFYGGVPLPQQIMERVYAADRTANEAPLLAMTKRTTLMKVQDLGAAFANKAEFDNKLAQWIAYRDNQQVKVVGQDEDVTQLDTSLADLDEVIMTQYQLVAALSKVPATKLLGTQPKGFNSTGEYEEASYHEELESLQTHELTQFLRRHHLIACRSKRMPDALREAAKRVAPTVSWAPLDSPTAKEWSEINLNKSQTAKNYVDSGAIDAYDVREALIKDTNSDFSDLASIERSDMPTNNEPDDADTAPQDTTEQA